MRDIEKNQTISKQYSCNIKSVSEEDKIITFMGTTTAPDRDGDIVMPKGANLNNFRNNPVFLWGHDWAGNRPPIGKSVEERVVENGIEFDIKFDEDDDFAMQVYNKYKNKFLNAVSIGFSVNDYEKRKDDDSNVVGYKFTDWELLELSGVPIPANPGALQRAKGMADDIEKEVMEMVHKAEEEEKELPEKEEELDIETFKEVAKILAQHDNIDEPHEQENADYNTAMDNLNSLEEKLLYLQGKITK